jgi:hypothetical protein
MHRRQIGRDFPPSSPQRQTQNGVDSRISQHRCRRLARAGTNVMTVSDDGRYNSTNDGTTMAIGLEF